MEELVGSALPLVETETIKKISARLIDIGVLHDEDLQFVEESDIIDLLKPIQARKLLKFCKNIGNSSSSDQNGTLSKSTASANPIISHKQCSESVVQFKSNSSVKENKILRKSTPSAGPTFLPENSSGSFVFIPFINNSSDPYKILNKNTQGSSTTVSLQECLVSSAFTPLEKNPSTDQDKTINARIPRSSPNSSKKKYSRSSSRTSLDHYELDFEIPWDSFPKAVLKACLDKKRLLKKHKHKMVRILVGLALELDPRFGIRQVRAIAERMVSKYPDTFQDEDGGYLSLTKSIITCVENKKRKPKDEDLKAITVKPSNESKKIIQNSLMPNNHVKEESDDSLEDIIFTVYKE